MTVTQTKNTWHRQST